MKEFFCWLIFFSNSLNAAPITLWIVKSFYSSSFATQGCNYSVCSIPVINVMMVDVASTRPTLIRLVLTKMYENVGYKNT